MHRYKELEIWNRAIELTRHVYSLSKSFPEDEKFGLTSQIRRAVVSIASNIAEGAGRNSNKEFNQFLGIAIGSIHEVETQLIISNKLGLTSEMEIDDLLQRIQELIKMTISLKSKLI